MLELAEGVARFGGPFDVADAWLTFQTGGKPQNAGEWQRWCARAAGFAKRDRYRSSSPLVTRAEPGYQQPPPVWKGHAEPEGGAVPPPDLLACLPDPGA